MRLIFFVVLAVWQKEFCKLGFKFCLPSDLNADVEKTYTNRKKKQLGYIQGTHYQFHRGDIRDLTGEMIWMLFKILTCSSMDSLVPSEIDAIFGGIDIRIAEEIYYFGNISE